MHNGHVSGYPQAAVLGIDLGTSGVKVLATSGDGRVLGRAAAAYQVRVPAAGRAETEPEDWWAATRTAVHAALAQAAAEAGRVTVTGLAVAGQMHGVVLTDDRGAALRPAILWLDQRAAAEAAGYADLPSDYTAVLGNRPSPGMAGPVLCWLASPRTAHAARLLVGAAAEGLAAPAADRPRRDRPKRRVWDSPVRPGS